MPIDGRCFAADDRQTFEDNLKRLNPVLFGRGEKVIRCTEIYYT